MSCLKILLQSQNGNHGKKEFKKNQLGHILFQSMAKKKKKKNFRSYSGSKSLNNIRKRGKKIMYI